MQGQAPGRTSLAGFIFFDSYRLIGRKNEWSRHACRSRFIRLCTSWLNSTSTTAYTMGLRQKLMAERRDSESDRAGKDLESPPDGVQVDAVFGEIDGEGPNYRNVSGVSGRPMRVGSHKIQG